MPREKLRWLPGALLLAGCGLAWLVAQGRAHGAAGPPEPPPPKVPFVEVRRRPVELTVHARGEVRPVHRIDLVAEVSGRVESLSPALEAGRFFEAGELLVSLDAADAELALERAEAVLAGARGAWRQAGARLERLTTLRARNVASRAAGEDAEYAERTAEAELREARAGRDEARRALERTRITAPFAGRVSERLIDPHQFVSRGTLLARIHATRGAEVRLPVAVGVLADLGLPLAGGEAPDGPHAVLRAQLGDVAASWPARIVRVEGEVSPRSRMVHVVARVEEPFAAGRPALAPGLFVEAEISGRSLPAVVELPRVALLPPDRVWIIDAAGRARGRRVDVLRAEAERVLVDGGLLEGERVCATTVGMLEGLRVRPVAYVEAPTP